MAGGFPLPVRVVAGMLATGVERVRHLPQDLPALSVTAAGRAVRASMRLQQEVAQLAGRGDEVLSDLFSRPSEHPAWAHFDEDDEADGAASAEDGASPPAAEPDHGPADMPGYDSLRLTQVRSRLRTLDADAVARLLEHERSGHARPPFLTVLGNRLTTLQADPGPDHRA